MLWLRRLAVCGMQDAPVRVGVMTDAPQTHYALAANDTVIGLVASFSSYSA